MANQNLEQLSYQEIWNAVYDTVNNRICLGSTANSNPPANLLSVQEILNRVYDETNNVLRTH